jgi:hypothetical protein
MWKSQLQISQTNKLLVQGGIIFPEIIIRVTSYMTYPDVNSSIRVIRDKLCYLDCISPLTT